MEHLRLAYDQYFAGVSKRAPLSEHDRFKTEFNKIPVHEIKSTVLKFRHQGLKSRHIQLNNLWQKTTSQIEEGTYRRDLFKLKVKEKDDELDSNLLSSSGVHSANAKKSDPTPQLPKSKTSAGLESLYEKYSHLAKAAGQNVPDKQKFIVSIQKQITAQKLKNPSAKIELGLQKDGAGKVQVKLKLQK